MTNTIPRKGGRLSQVDALRGMAALAVVLFHFTTRVIDVYQPGYVPIFAVPYGYFGVNLFFIVSGFVIWLATITLAGDDNYLGGFDASTG